SGKVLGDRYYSVRYAVIKKEKIIHPRLVGLFFLLIYKYFLKAPHASSFPSPVSAENGITMSEESTCNVCIVCFKCVTFFSLGILLTFFSRLMVVCS